MANFKFNVVTYITKNEAIFNNYNVDDKVEYEIETNAEVFEEFLRVLKQETGLDGEDWREMDDYVTYVKDLFRNYMKVDKNNASFAPKDSEKAVLNVPVIVYKDKLLKDYKTKEYHED